MIPPHSGFQLVPHRVLVTPRRYQEDHFNINSQGGFILKKLEEIKNLSVFFIMFNKNVQSLKCLDLSITIKAPTVY